jgi:hypothetical protein
MGPAVVAGPAGSAFIAAPAGAGGPSGSDNAPAFLLAILVGLPLAGVGVFFATRKRPGREPRPVAPVPEPLDTGPFDVSAPASRDVPRVAVPAVLTTGDPLLRALAADRARATSTSPGFHGRASGGRRGTSVRARPVSPSSRSDDRGEAAVRS